MNEILKIIFWIILGVLASSFVWGIIIHQHEMGHRNFEYIQCNQFWKLAIITNKTDIPLFDCNLILKKGVLDFEIITHDNAFEPKTEYAYQDYANKYTEEKKQ